MTLSAHTRSTRVGLHASVDPQVLAAARTTAAVRGVRMWQVIEDAVWSGLEHVPSAHDPAVPRGARVPYRDRARAATREAFYVDVDAALVDAVKDAGAGKLHHWWVIEQALSHGLGLLPAQQQEVLPATA